MGRRSYRENTAVPLLHQRLTDSIWGFCGRPGERVGRARVDLVFPAFLARRVVPTRVTRGPFSCHICAGNHCLLIPLRCSRRRVCMLPSYETVISTQLHQRCTPSAHPRVSAVVIAKLCTLVYQVVASADVGAISTGKCSTHICPQIGGILRKRRSTLEVRPNFS